MSTNKSKKSSRRDSDCGCTERSAMPGARGATTSEEQVVPLSDAGKRARHGDR